jgi:hypothetical protein
MKTPHALPFLMLGLCFCVISCKQGKPANVIPEPKFVSLYAKLTTNSVTARPVIPDSLSPARMVDSVLASEGVTRDQFSATVRWYNEDIRRWKPFFDEVVQALEDSVRKQQKTQ